MRCKMLALFLTLGLSTTGFSQSPFSLNDASSADNSIPSLDTPSSSETFLGEIENAPPGQAFTSSSANSLSTETSSRNRQSSDSAFTPSWAAPQPIPLIPTAEQPVSQNVIAPKVAPKKAYASHPTLEGVGVWSPVGGPSAPRPLLSVFQDPSCYNVWAGYNQQRSSELSRCFQHSNGSCSCAQMRPQYFGNVCGAPSCGPSCNRYMNGSVGQGQAFAAPSAGCQNCVSQQSAQQTQPHQVAQQQPSLATQELQITPSAKEDNSSQLWPMPSLFGNKDKVKETSKTSQSNLEIPTTFR